MRKVEYLDRATKACHSNPKRKRGNRLRWLPRLRFGLFCSRRLPTGRQCKAAAGNTSTNVVAWDHCPERSGRDNGPILPVGYFPAAA